MLTRPCQHGAPVAGGREKSRPPKPGPLEGAVGLANKKHNRLSSLEGGLGCCAPGNATTVGTTYSRRPGAIVCALSCEERKGERDLCKAPRPQKKGWILLAQA